MDFRASSNPRCSTRVGAPPVRPGGGGFTLIELLIAFTVMLVAASIFYRMISSTGRLRQVQRETSIAADAARVVIEQMRNEDFALLFRLYNADPSDDPDGPGTAPGNSFPVDELQPVPGTAGVGAVELPSKWMDVIGQSGGSGGGATGLQGPATEKQLWLMENVSDPTLGLPRDLNGDDVVDSKNHSEDYVLLPVRIRLQWQGRFGPRSLTVETMLADYEVVQ